MEGFKLGFGKAIFFFSSARRLARGLIRDERGQGTVEYILILSFVVVGASALAKTVLSGLDKGILTMGAELEKDLKTGRAPISVWSN